jgi:maltooligosyltrehalose trehalohydrolase
MAQFPSLGIPQMRAQISRPHYPRTYERAKLDLSERVSNAAVYRMHRDLLRLRREDVTFRLQGLGGLDGAVLGAEAFVLRYFSDSSADRLLLVNFGLDLRFDPAPEPLLAPPEGMRWETLWSSEDPAYGGSGTPALDSAENWRIPGHTAVALRPRPVRAEDIEAEERLEKEVAERKKQDVRKRMESSDG